MSAARNPHYCSTAVCHISTRWLVERQHHHVPCSAVPVIDKPAPSPVQSDQGGQKHVSWYRLMVPSTRKVAGRRRACVQHGPARPSMVTFYKKDQGIASTLV